MYRQLPGQNQPLSLSERLVAEFLYLTIWAIGLVQIISTLAALVAAGYFLFHMEWVVVGIIAIAWSVFLIFCEIVSRVFMFFMSLALGW